MAILTCPGCGRGGLRVPDGKRGKVTCPTCGAEWFHPEQIELSEVAFRCAKSGAHFAVILSRKSPLHKFAIEKIRRPVAAAESSSGQSTPVTSKSVVNSEPASLRLRGPRGWLARLTDRFIAPSSPQETSNGVSPANSVSSIDRHDAGEYNWSGFSCPYCGDTSFVRCSRGHLACQGTTELRNGRRFHRCFCGGAGYIEGSIESFHDRRQSFEPDVTPKQSEPMGWLTSGYSAATALPAPQGKGPPAMR
jgi:predicted RNA-binding Zn-ribbon protein involved in translation (DUF1610 family)/uncharacterized Zn finger protein (UPF0148 family)